MKQIGDFIGGIIGLIFLGWIVFSALTSGNKTAIIVVLIIGIIIFIAVIREDRPLKERDEKAKASTKTSPPKPAIYKTNEITPRVVNEIDTKSANLRNKWIEKQKEILLNYNSLLELLKTNPVNSIDYRNLLNCFEWQFKRFKILVRDNFCCIDCNISSYELHVHHKYYLKDFLPWEIEDLALVSLCRSCHSKCHKNDDIKVYNKVGTRLVLSDYPYFFICPRCHGTGYLPHFKHVEDGVCFLCWGNIVSNSVFYDRIIKIVNDPNSYDLNERFDECFNFLDSISLDFYKNHIQDKLENEDEDELTKFFSSHVPEDDLPF